MVGYEKPTNLPTSVTFFNLDSLLPRTEFDALLENGSKDLEGFISHLADYGRFLAVDHLSKSIFIHFRYVWIFDIEMLWFREPLCQEKHTATGQSSTATGSSSMATGQSSAATGQSAEPSAAKGQSNLLISAYGHIFATL